MSFYRKLTVIILSLSLGACSTFGFLFERLPWLSSWQLSRMFDLNDQQEEQVEVVAEEMKAWFDQNNIETGLNTEQFNRSMIKAVSVFP